MDIAWRPVGDVPARRRDDGRVAACHGREHLALPGGPAALRNGHTGGLPLLAPWANRLASRRYRGWGGSPSTRAGSASSPTTTGCPSTGSSWARPAGRVDRLVATARPHRVSTRRSTSIRPPSRSRTGSTCTPPHRHAARRRHHDRSDRPPAHPRSRRLAPVPPAPRYAAPQLDPASPVARAPRARRPRHSHRPFHTGGPARSGPDRLAHLRRPARARARPHARVRGRAAAPSSSTAALATRTRRCGSRRATTSERSSPSSHATPTRSSPATRPWSRPATATSHAHVARPLSRASRLAPIHCATTTAQR